LTILDKAKHCGQLMSSNGPSGVEMA